MKESTIIETRAADENHVVHTVKATGPASYRRAPCAGCPWIKDNAGLFPAEAFRHSANTAFDMSQKVFACHESGHEKPATCAGFLLQNSADNLAIRIRQSTGEIDLRQVTEGGYELHSSYRAMAEANGVPENDPAIAKCRP